MLQKHNKCGKNPIVGLGINGRIKATITPITRFDSVHISSMPQIFGLNLTLAKMANSPALGATILPHQRAKFKIGWGIIVYLTGIFPFQYVTTISSLLHLGRFIGCSYSSIQN